MAYRSWKPARSRVFNYGKAHGGISGIEFDMTESFFGGLDNMSLDAIQAMTKRLNDGMAQAFKTNGYGTWQSNTDMTEEGKGHGIVMAGRTHAMLEAIGLTGELLRTQSSTTLGLMRSTGSASMMRGFVRKGLGSFSTEYGWPQTPHPDTDGSIDPITGEMEKQPSSGRANMTIEDVAMLHEAGFTVSIPLGNGRKTEKKVAPRRWLSLAVEKEGVNMASRAFQDVQQSLDAFDVVARTSTMGTQKARRVGVAPAAPKIADALTITKPPKTTAGSGSKPKLFNRKKKR